MSPTGGSFDAKPAIVTTHGWATTTTINPEPSVLGQGRSQTATRPTSPIRAGDRLSRSRRPASSLRTPRRLRAIRLHTSHGARGAPGPDRFCRPDPVKKTAKHTPRPSQGQLTTVVRQPEVGKSLARGPANFSSAKTVKLRLPQQVQLLRLRHRSRRMMVRAELRSNEVQDLAEHVSDITRLAAGRSQVHRPG